MKIDYLKINSRFKNLDQITVNFDENQLTTVIVGWNGAGKSNVIEAIVAIFINLDQAKSPPFAYEIQYKLGDDTEKATWVKVAADPLWGRTPSKQYKIQYSLADNQTLFDEKAWTDVPLSKVASTTEGYSLYLPRHVFAYYSGPSDRLEEYFKKPRAEFYKKLLYGGENIKGTLRRFFYAKPIYSQFVLLAFFLSESNSQELKFLSDQLGIEGLDSVHFVFRRPSWTKASQKTELFWGAFGKVREFLDKLYPHTLAPLKITRTEDISLTGSNVKNEFLHLFLPDQESLLKVADFLEPVEFFKMLESTLYSEMLLDVRVRVRVKHVDQSLSFKELSEGEQQLLAVLGLLKFTGDRDSLFLLDEPDTHLNPSWDVKFLHFLRTFVPNQSSSHVIMVTHNPLALAELEKEQVQVMWRDADLSVFADFPAEDPRGMGFSGLLTSDLFGLESALDIPTQELVDRKQFLVTKQNLSPDESKELLEIDEKLSSLGINYASRDPLYSLFLEKLAEHNRNLYKHQQTMLTKKQRQELDEITRKIVEEIKAEDNTESEL